MSSVSQLSNCCQIYASVTGVDPITIRQLLDTELIMAAL